MVGRFRAGVIYWEVQKYLVFPGGSVVKTLPTNAGTTGDVGSIPGVGKTLWRRKWQPASVFSPGKSRGQRSLAGCSPWGCKRVEHDLVTNTANNRNI